MRLRPQGPTKPAHRTSENNWIASFLHFLEHFVAKLIFLTCLIWNLYKCEHSGDIFGLEVFRPSDLSLLYFLSGASLSFSLSYMCFILFVCFAVCMGGGTCSSMMRPEDNIRHLPLVTLHRCIWRWAPSLHLQLSHLSPLAGQWAQESSCPHHTSRLGLWALNTTPGFLCGFWGPNSGPSSLCLKSAYSTQQVPG